MAKKVIYIILIILIGFGIFHIMHKHSVSKLNQVEVSKTSVLPEKVDVAKSVPAASAVSTSSVPVASQESSPAASGSSTSVPAQ